MAFKVEVRDNENLITFGPRYPGQIGKDILAVKIALGIITTVAGQVSAAEQDQNQAPEDSSTIPLDSQGWFDCATGLGIDLVRASTFDDSLQKALTRYQIENRFLITCYLFQTYAVRSLIASTDSQYSSDEELEEYSRSINQQLFAIERLFDSEYGLLGEATVAVMHGWKPHSVLQNIGFNHPATKFSEDEFAVDVIPQVLFEDFISGILGQTPQSMVDQGIVPEVHAYPNSKVKLRQYKIKVSTGADWIKIKRSQIPVSSDVFEEILTYGVPYPWGSIDYNVQLDQRSILYTAAVRVMQTQEEFEDDSLIPADVRKERMKKFFYPDPFSNPDPFYINENEIGFFDETPFFLSSQGPIPTEDPEVIADLEEKALQKVLSFYNKPEIWYFLRDDFEFASTYFSQTAAPSTSNLAPTTGLFPRNIKDQDIEKTAAYKILNTKIFNKEQAIERLRQSIESTTIHTAIFPAEFESPTEYRSFVERKIRILNQEINVLKSELEIIKDPTPQYKKQMYMPISTRNIIDQAPQGSLYSWRQIDRNNAPLISFVEFRTPSLRPSQAYRAFYIINKRKLDIITAGESLIQEESPPRRTPAETDETDDQACLDQNTEQAERTYEEYRVHAQKKRREIVRALRERVEAKERQDRGDGSWNISRFDLPTIGPFDLDAAFTQVLGLNNLSNDADYTKAVIRVLAEGIDDIGEFLGFNDDFEELEGLIEKQKKGDVSKGVDHIKISLHELDQRIGQLSKDLSKASAILENEGISFAKGSDFDSENEARLLSVFRSELVEMIDSFNESANIQPISELDPKNIGIRIVFKKTTQSGLGAKAGKYITDIYFDTMDESYVGIFLGVPIQKEIPAQIFDDRKPNLVKIFKRYETLNRSRTVNYISNIIEITNPYPSSLKEFVGSFFDDKANACAGLFGTDAEKNIAISLVGSYTSGLSVNRKEEEELAESFKSWGKKHFVEPFALWWEKSAKNASESLEDTFDEEQALRSLGKMCTLEDLYEEFIDKVDLLTLLCNYLECVKLPGFSLKLPNLHLPPFPKIPIIGWYAGLLDFLIKNMRQILIRILCTFVRTIIDKLAFPFCEEQLQEFIAAGSSATPLMNEALIAALTNTGIPQGYEDEAKSFFEDASKITTGQELCYLLGGKQLDAAGMQMLKGLVRNRGLADSLDTSEAISNFFGVLGSYLPFEFCQQLSQIETPMAMSCKDAADSLLSIRNRLQSGDSSLQDSEIDEAMALADKNLKEQKESLASFSGSSIDAMLPENLKPNSNNMIVTQMPEILTAQLKVAAEALFEPARKAYMTNLSSFVAGMQSQVQEVPAAGDPEYNDIEVLRLETALEQLKNYSYKLSRTTDQDIQNYERQIQIQEQSLQTQATEKGLNIPESVLKFKSETIATYYAQHLKGIYIIDQIMSTWEWMRKYNDSIPEARDLLVHYDKSPIGQLASGDDIEIMKGFVHGLLGHAFETDIQPPEERIRPTYNIHDNYDFETILQSGIWSSNDGAFQQSSDRPYDTLDEFSLRTLGLPSQEFQRVSSESEEDRARKDFYNPDRGNISWWHYPLSPEGFKGTQPSFAPFWNPDTWSTVGSPSASSQVNIVDVYRSEMNGGVAPGISTDGYDSYDILGDYSPLRSTEIEELIPLPAITIGSKIFSNSNTNSDIETNESIVFRTARIEAEDLNAPELAFLAYSPNARRYWNGIETSNENALSKAAILENYFRDENPWHYNSWINNFLIDYLIPLADAIHDVSVPYGENTGLPVTRILSPREDNNVTLKNRTKKMLSHNYLVGARNYLVRSLIFLKDFVKEKKNFQNIIFERFNSSDENAPGLYENLTVQQREEALLASAGKPIIFPDDLRVLYEVYEIEKYPIPKENRQRGERDYHWVHKKYKVNRYEGIVFEDSLVEIGKEVTDDLPTPYDTYIRDLRDSFKVAPGPRENPYTAPPGTYSLRPMRVLSGLFGNQYDGIQYIIDNDSTGSPTLSPDNDDNLDVARSAGLCKQDFFDYYYSARNLHPSVKASSPLRGGIDPNQALTESIEVNHILSLDPHATGKITAFGPSHIGTPVLTVDDIEGDAEDVARNALTSWLRKIDRDPGHFQSTAVLNLAMERVEYLSAAIIQIMNDRPNIVQEKHLAIVKEVLSRTNDNRSFDFGHINYSCIPDEPTQAFNLPSGDYKGDLINIEFEATPYTPSIKMVEMLTKEKTQDRYNIVIDSDTFIHQGFRSQEGNYLQYEDPIGVQNSYHYGKTPASSRLNKESLLILDQYETPSRKIMKFCDPLPLEMVSNNDPVPEKGDFSKREAFAKMVINSLESTLGGDFSSKENDIKRSVFKLNTKSIFSELMSSIQFSAMFLPEYAQELDKRLSSRPYIIPGTRCIKNRYGFIESSLLAFDNVILGDMASEITQEIKKPENSPWNRSFNDLSPFDKAARKIAVKGHIRVCLVELLLKGALAYSVWDIESIVSEPSIIEYAHSKIYHELNISPSLRDHWAQILEDATGINNKSEALYSVIREEIIKLPAYSRQVFNPGEGHKDFHNWYIYGRTLERYAQPQEEQVQNSFFTPEGLFKRLPVPSDVVVPVDPKASPEGLDFVWKIRDHSGRSFLSEMSSFKRRGTRASVDATSQSGRNGGFHSHDHVSEFIFEDYVRINGEILNYYTEPNGVLIEGVRGCPPTREELRMQQLAIKIEDFCQSVVSLYHFGGVFGGAQNYLDLNDGDFTENMYARFPVNDLVPYNPGAQWNYVRENGGGEYSADAGWYSMGQNNRTITPAEAARQAEIEAQGLLPNAIGNFPQYNQWFYDNPLHYDSWRYYKHIKSNMPGMPNSWPFERTRPEGINIFPDENQGRAEGDESPDLFGPIIIGSILADMALEIHRECLNLGLNVRICPNAWALSQPSPLSFIDRPDEGQRAQTRQYDYSPWRYNSGIIPGFENKVGWLPIGGVMNAKDNGARLLNQLYTTTQKRIIDAPGDESEYDLTYPEYRNQLPENLTNEEASSLVPRHGPGGRQFTILEMNVPLEQAIEEGLVPESGLAAYDDYDSSILPTALVEGDAPLVNALPPRPVGGVNRPRLDIPTCAVFNFGNPNGELFYRGSYRYNPNNNRGGSSFTGNVEDGTNNIEKYQRMVISYEFPDPSDCPDAANIDPGEEGLYLESLRSLQEPIVVSIQEFNNLMERIKEDPDTSTLERVLSNSGVSQGIRLTQVLAGDKVSSNRDNFWINPLIRQMWESPNIVNKTITERAYAISLGDISSYEDLRKKTLQTWMRRTGMASDAAAREIGLDPGDRGNLRAEGVPSNELVEEVNLVLRGLGENTYNYDEIADGDVLLAASIDTFSGLERFVVDKLITKYTDLGLITNLETYAATIPLVSYEEDICNNIIESGIDFLDPEVMNSMSEKLADQPEFKYIMDYMFPIRRFMAIMSMHSTSILGGYGKLPKLFAPTKAKLGMLAQFASTPPNLRLNLPSMTQAQFAMDLRNNFPGDPEDPSCFDFPGIPGEMLEAFWEELKELVEEFPSRLFRGLANTMDPAYKEMRAHFMNCDIKDLNWRGVNYSGAKDDKLVNGLKPNRGPRTKSGKYTPLILGMGADLIFSFEDFPYKLPSRIGKMVARLGAYIYSGGLPFIDPSGFFRIPCIEYDESWAENEKWDLGYYGRYGHPISPITAIALSTRQLKADLDKRNNNCPDEEVDLDCEDNS